MQQPDREAPSGVSGRAVRSGAAARNDLDSDAAATPSCVRCDGQTAGHHRVLDRRHTANARRLPEREPKKILEARFAAGEIDEPEFNRRMRALTYGPPLELDGS